MVRILKEIDKIFLIISFIILLIGIGSGTLILFKNFKFSLPLTYLYYLHPLFQIFFFISFVNGVALSILPKFKGLNFFAKFSLKLFLTFLMFIISLILFIITVLYYYLIYIANVLLFIFSIIIFYYFLKVSLIKANFPEADPLFILSGISLVLSSLILIMNPILNYENYNLYFITMFFLGFIGSMIYGVEIRMVAIRQTINYKSITHIGNAFQTLAIITVLISYFLKSKSILIISYLLLFLSSIFLVISLRIFEFKRPLTIHKLTISEKRIIYYNQTSLIISYLWLFSYFILFILYNNMISKEMFIHILSLGYVGNTIIGFFPFFIPFILFKKSPQKVISFIVLITYNIGAFLRILSSFYDFPSWSFLSGIIIFIVIFILVSKLLHKNQRKTNI